jgi:hypothetical protein
VILKDVLKNVLKRDFWIGRRTSRELDEALTPASILWPGTRRGSIMEFREGLVARETQYFTDRFDPAPSRAHLVVRMDEITPAPDRP